MTITEPVFPLPPAGICKGLRKRGAGQPGPSRPEREQAAIMSVFVVAQELQTACNCRQQVGVSVGRERGRQREQAVIRACQPSPTPGNGLAELPFLAAEPAGCLSLLRCVGTAPLKRLLRQSLLGSSSECCPGSGSSDTAVSLPHISSSACCCEMPSCARVVISKRKHVYL